MRRDVMCTDGIIRKSSGEEVGMKKRNKQLLTPDEVADMIRVARKTVVVMAREGRIPCIRIGRFVRFDAPEIDRWIDSQRS